MKRIIFYSIVMVSVFSMFSCNRNFIDIPQKGTLDLDNYFANLDECQSFIGGIYQGFAGLNDWTQGFQRLNNEMSTDDAWMGNLNQSNANSYGFAFYTLTASNAPWTLDNFYACKYTNITACNEAIASIPNAPISTSDKNNLIGQAKFFRAFDYWELVQNFGDVVLTKNVLGTSQMNLARSPKDSVYAFIVADLKDAAAKLPNQWTGNDIGRVTSGACKALLARTYLFMKDYTNAYAYADSVIKSGYYSLEPNFINIWSPTNHNGVESIFESQTNSNQNFSVGSEYPIIENARGEHWPASLSSNALDGWGWDVPTSNLEQAYKSEGDSIRLKSTIIRLGLPVYGDSIDNPHYEFDSTLNKSCRTWRKFYTPIAIRKTLTSKDGHMPSDMIWLRLAEMYLTRAEAAYFLNNSTQALADINTIRARVNLPAESGLTGNTLLYAIWKERRLELAGEWLRLYDLRREIDPVANKPMIELVMDPNGTFVQYDLAGTDYWDSIHPTEPSNKGSFFTAGKNELWPIPQDEIDRSQGKLTQNPGY